MNPENKLPEQRPGDTPAEQHVFSSFVFMPPCDPALASFSFSTADMGLNYRPQDASLEAPASVPVEKSSRFIEFIPERWSDVRSGDVLDFGRYSMLVLAVNPSGGDTARVSYVRNGPDGEMSFATRDCDIAELAYCRNAIALRGNTSLEHLQKLLQNLPGDRLDRILANAPQLLEHPAHLSQGSFGGTFICGYGAYPIQKVTALVDAQSGLIVHAPDMLNPRRALPVTFDLRISSEPAESYFESFSDGSSVPRYEFLQEQDPMSTFTVDSSQFGVRKPLNIETDPEESETAGTEPEEGQDFSGTGESFEPAGWNHQDCTFIEEEEPQFMGLSPQIMDDLDLCVEIVNSFYRARKFQGL